MSSSQGATGGPSLRGRRVGAPRRGRRAAELGRALREDSNRRRGPPSSSSIVIAEILRRLVGPSTGTRSDATEMEQDFERRARHAIRANLWPKMITAPGDDEPPMALELTVSSRPIDLGVDQGGALLLWGAGLNAIRAARAGASEIRTPQGVPVEVIEILRNRKVIGHLALVRRIPAAESYLAFDDLDPAREDESRLLRIALMRGQAELVVTTVDWVRREAPVGTDWLAVFRRPMTSTSTTPRQSPRSRQRVTEARAASPPRSSATPRPASGRGSPRRSIRRSRSSPRPP